MGTAKVWVAGQHAVGALLTINPERALAVFCELKKDNPVQSQILEMAARLGLPLHPVDRQQLSEQCGMQNHQGIAVQARPQRERGERELDQFIADVTANRAPFLLILDHVQDPHNFGACLRTADAAGVDAVIVTRDKSSPLTTVVLKVASGAVETTPIFRVANLARVMEALKRQGVWMIGTSDKATHSLYRENLVGPVAIVVGAEDKGLRKLTQSKCDVLVKLPVSGSVVSSLNVSVATGVCLYEVRRQRLDVE